MSTEVTLTEMIQLCINTLMSNAVTPEEEALGYFTRKKSKRLSTWDEWKAGEKKQIDQFDFQGIFGIPTDPIGIPPGSIILYPYWQYAVKQFGVHQSRLCCNGSKKAIPQLHAVASTWSLCVELPIHQIFLGICANAGLTIYGGDATDAYAHSLAPNDTYLQVDNAYVEGYKNKTNETISKKIILPVKHALQGHPKSGKIWMKMIDDILINKLGFRTTTHNRCIYLCMRKGCQASIVITPS